MARLPRISVILPVYNGAADVSQAISSILTQTCADFELIVVNDGSTDATSTILARLRDPRVRVVTQQNRGLASSLNHALSLCSGTYVARQDHDDISLPTRLAQQAAFLDAHPSHGLVGTRAEIHTGGVASGRFHDHPTEHATLRFELLFDNPFVHSSVMLRRSALETVGGYAVEPGRQPEDYELWSRLVRAHQVANLPERLVIYREVPGSLSRVSRRPFTHNMVQLSAENLAALFGLAAPTIEMIDAAALVHADFDLLSPRPNLPAMLALIHRAALICAPGLRGGDVPLALLKRQKQIRQQYRLRSKTARVLVQLVEEVRRRTAASP